GRYVFCRNAECGPDNKCMKLPEPGEPCSEPQGFCAGSAVCIGDKCKALSTEVCSDSLAAPNGGSYLNAAERRSIMGRPSRQLPGRSHNLDD
ncbi:MAG: hypothetical protein ABW133_25190, partial [Polyangiaceae bacterium]